MGDVLQMSKQLLKQSVEVLLVARFQKCTCPRQIWNPKDSSTLTLNCICWAHVCKDKVFPSKGLKFSLKNSKDGSVDLHRVLLAKKNIADFLCDPILSKIQEAIDDARAWKCGLVITGTNK